LLCNGALIRCALVAPVDHYSASDLARREEASSSAQWRRYVDSAMPDWFAAAVKIACWSSFRITRLSRLSFIMVFLL
jgi:hypothetical protein